MFLGRLASTAWRPGDSLRFVHSACKILMLNAQSLLKNQKLTFNPACAACAAEEAEAPEEPSVAAAAAAAPAAPAAAARRPRAYRGMTKIDLLC